MSGFSMSDLTAQRDDAFEPDEEALAAALRNQDDIPILMDVVADKVEGSDLLGFEDADAEMLETETLEVDQVDQVDEIAIEPDGKGISQEAHFAKMFDKHDKETDINHESDDSLESIDVELGDMTFVDLQQDAEVSLQESESLNDDVLQVIEIPENTDDVLDAKNHGTDDCVVQSVDVEIVDFCEETYTQELIAKSVAEVLERRLPELVADVMLSLQAAQKEKRK